MYSGKTVVDNTDAEGRLELVDGVAYAVKHLNPKVVVDMATLTGAQQGRTEGQNGGAPAPPFFGEFFRISRELRKKWGLSPIRSHSAPLFLNCPLWAASASGAQGISTGNRIGAIYTNNENLEGLAVMAGKISGDLVHPMPCAPEFHRRVPSQT
ncbi:hypothetical protein PF011_g20777 [Phytophthora fragariae]|uniref:Cytosol aminopeptidase domain-containing protein n=1 Tax=Phytophthora fragariae TaxID=53985 RepID=A0A6A3INC7_9STRA|nr:hypothetical protein PF011_g20777 [Phytophthora fragariae]